MAEYIGKWQANDGSEWRCREDAEKRDQLIEQVKMAMAPLGEIPDLPGCSFANGGGYLQHSPETVRQVRLALYEVSKPNLGWWYSKQKEEHGKTDYELAVEVHPSWHLRILDGGCSPLERAYGRVACIDGRAREWGQPYYASHPNEAKQVQLNK